MLSTSKSLGEVVISDSTPLNYLILIGEVDILRTLYGAVTIPNAVRDELLADGAPTPVKEWMTDLPDWLSVASGELGSSLPFPDLGDGERQAIALAVKSASRTLLTDDLDARNAAESVGLQVVPTIRILTTASDLSLVDFDLALSKLLETNFRVSSKVIKQVRQRSSVRLE